VDDTGPGISSDEQAGLFRPFVQSQSGRNLQGGTGLGLAISQQFIRLMGGEIRLTSELGKGSAFRFEVPIQSVDEEFVAKQGVPRRVSGLQPGQRTPKVLIVDDEPNNRGWLASLLKIIGFGVREAEDGASAVRLWQEWKPDLVLMDMRMPVMDGLEATRTIRQQPNGTETVILALTASALDEDRRGFMQSGVDDYVAKPFQEDELLRKMQTHLNLSYTYGATETAWSGSGDVDQPSAGPVQIQDLPPELIDALNLAIRNGEKDRLDELIEQAGAWNVAVSLALKDLASRYEYDALTDLLKGVEV
jgi:CheY-like chemotaxis protein